MKYATLKKEYSISCKDYVTLGICANTSRYIVICEGVLLADTDDLEVANKSFYFWVNKI